LDIAPLIVALKVGVFAPCLLIVKRKVDVFEIAFLTNTILTLFNLLLLKEIMESHLHGL